MSKTIMISQDAYDRLQRLKRQGESFTDVIQRLTGREDLTRFAGSISAGFAKELRDSSRAFRDRFDREFRRREH